jgi:hypothetical protein
MLFGYTPIPLAVHVLSPYSPALLISGVESGGITLREAAFAIGYLFYFEAGCLRKLAFYCIFNDLWLLCRLVYSGQTEILTTSALLE